MPATLRSPLARVALAGPGAGLASWLAVVGMAVWLPPGAAGIDQLTLPMALFPLVWAALFFEACLDRSLARAGAVLFGVAALNAVAVAWHLSAPLAPSTPVGSP